jgi:hypothetical protein
MPVGDPILLSMPFLAYVHEPRPGQPEARAWEPNWSVWRPALGALAAVLTAGAVHGYAGLALVVFAFWLGYRAIDAALPYRQGLREHHQ